MEAKNWKGRSPARSLKSNPPERALRAKEMELFPLSGSIALSETVPTGKKLKGKPISRWESSLKKGSKVKPTKALGMLALN